MVPVRHIFLGVNICFSKTDQVCKHCVYVIVYEWNHRFCFFLIQLNNNLCKVAPVDFSLKMFVFYANQRYLSCWLLDSVCQIDDCFVEIVFFRIFAFRNTFICFERIIVRIEFMLVGKIFLKVLVSLSHVWNIYYWQNGQSP